jgi:hypothetical protein
MSRRRLSLVALALTGALFLAACGDSSSSSSDTAKPNKSATTVKKKGGSSKTSDTASVDTAPLDTTGDTKAPVDTNFSGKGSSKICSDATKFQKDFADIGGSLTGASTPDQAKQIFTQLNDALDKLAGDAPKEIKADVQTIADAFKKLNDVMAKFDYDFTKLATDPTAAQELTQFASGDVEAAGQRVTAYFAQVCGITDTTG